MLVIPFAEGALPVPSRKKTKPHSLPAALFRIGWLSIMNLRHIMHLILAALVAVSVASQSWDIRPQSEVRFAPPAFPNRPAQGLFSSMSAITSLGDLDGDGRALEFAAVFQYQSTTRIDILWLDGEGVLRNSTQIYDGSPYLSSWASVRGLDFVGEIAFLGDIDRDGSSREFVVQARVRRTDPSLVTFWLTSDGHVSRVSANANWPWPSAAKTTLYDAVGSSRAMVLGNDMNGDGIPNDMIVATARALTFFVVDADGIPVNVSTTNCRIVRLCDIHGLARLGDVDGDGVSQEIAIASSHNTVSVVWLDSSGAMIHHVTSTVTTPTWPGAVLQASGDGMIQIGSATDLDGDGKSLELLLMLGQSRSRYSRQYACAFLNASGVVTRAKAIPLEPHLSSGLKAPSARQSYVNAALWTSIPFSTGAIAFVNAGQTGPGNDNLVLMLDANANVLFPIRQLLRENNGLDFVVPADGGWWTENSIAYIEGISAGGRNAAMVVGHPSQYTTGVVYVIFLNATAVEHFQPITFGLNGLPAEYRRGSDELGSAVSALGDLDHDGSAVELAISSRSGLVIAWLARNGTAERTVLLNATTIGQSRLDPQARVRSICLLGDLDGDGHAGEVALGWAGSATPDPSLTILWLTRDASIASQHQLIPDLAAETVLRPQLVEFGSSISLVGDANGDGLDSDIVVGSMGWDAFWVLSLDRAGGLVSQWPIRRSDENACASLSTSMTTQLFGRLVLSNGWGPGEASDWMNLLVLGSNTPATDGGWWGGGEHEPQVCMQWVNRSGALSEVQQSWSGTSLGVTLAASLGSSGIIVSRFPQIHGGIGRSLVIVSDAGIRAFHLPLPSQFPSASPSPSGSPAPSVSPSAAPSPSAYPTRMPFLAAGSLVATHRCNSESAYARSTTVTWLGCDRPGCYGSTILAVCASCRTPQSQARFYHLDSQGCPNSRHDAITAEMARYPGMVFERATALLPLSDDDDPDFGHAITVGDFAVRVRWISKTPELRFARTVTLDLTAGMNDATGGSHSIHGWTPDSIAVLGDLERRGQAIDILFGFSDWNSHGAVVVYSLRRRGNSSVDPSRVKSVVTTGSTGLHEGTPPYGAYFGENVESLGPLSGGQSGADVLVGAPGTILSGRRSGVIHRLRLDASGSVTWMETIESPFGERTFGIGMLSIGREATGWRLAIVASSTGLWQVAIPPTTTASMIHPLAIMTFELRGHIGSFHRVAMAQIQQPVDDGSVLVAFGGTDARASYERSDDDPLVGFRVLTLSLIPSPTASASPTACSGPCRATHPPTHPAASVAPLASPGGASQTGASGDAATDGGDAPTPGTSEIAEPVLVGVLSGAGVILLLLLSLFFFSRHRSFRSSSIQSQVDRVPLSSRAAADERLASRTSSRTHVSSVSGVADAPHAVIPDDRGSWERSSCAKALCESTLLWGACFRVDLRLCCRQWQPATQDLVTRVQTARSLALSQLAGIGIGYLVAYLQAPIILLPLAFLASQSSYKNAAYLSNAWSMLPKSLTHAAMLATALYMAAAVANVVTLSGLMCIASTGCSHLSPMATLAFFWIGAVAFAVAALASGHWLGRAADIARNSIPQSAVRETGSGAAASSPSDDRSSSSATASRARDPPTADLPSAAVSARPALSPAPSARPALEARQAPSLAHVGHDSATVELAATPNHYDFTKGIAL